MTFTRTARAALVTGAFGGLLGVGLSLGPACGASSASGDGGPEGGQSAEALFRAIEKPLVNRCGAKDGVCHVKGSYNDAPRWLAEPDAYASAKGFRGVVPVTRDVADSTLLTQAEHVGPSLDSTPDLRDKVREWLQAEVGPAKLPATEPFFVQTGLNAIDLKGLAPGLEGSKIEFFAESSGSVLTLSNIRLHASLTSNVKLESPFFVQLPKAGRTIADPANAGFEGPLEAPAGTRQVFYKGSLVLLGWTSQTRLKLVFAKIEATSGKGVTPDCKALALFEQSAIPAFQTVIDIIPDPQDGGPLSDAAPFTSSCSGCHAGGDGDDVAKNAMDLADIGTDNAKACAQARRWINLADKEKSVILLNPQGKANELHPMKSLPSNHPVVEGLRRWVNAE